MSKCLIAEYDTNAAAKISLEVLAKSGFTLNQVSVVSSASDPAAERLHNLTDNSESEHTSASAPEGRSTSLGMLIGGTVAAPIAAGTLIGPFMIAGPLIGMAIGAAVGSLMGMQHWGVARDVSAEYEERVKQGAVLVIVHDVDDVDFHGAEASLKTTGPRSLELYS